MSPAKRIYEPRIFEGRMLPEEHPRRRIRFTKRSSRSGAWNM
jgi:hypothetical protein